MSNKSRRCSHTLRFCRSCACKHSYKRGCKNNTFISRKAGGLPNDLSFRKLTKIAKEAGWNVGLDSLTQLKTYSVELQKADAKSRSNLVRQSNRKAKKRVTEIQLSSKRGKKPGSIPIDCPICLSYKGLSIQMGCGPSICKDCFNKILDTDSLRDSCPLCRQYIFSENIEEYALTKYSKSGDGLQIIPSPTRHHRRYLLIKVLSESDDESDWDSDE